MAATHSVTGEGVFTPTGFARAIVLFGEEAVTAVLNEAWKLSKIPRAIAVKRFAAHGVGKGIFGKKNSGAYKIITAAAKRIGDAIILQLQSKGFAAMQEQGGSTKPHRIGSKKRDTRFLGNIKNGFAARGPVQHPGGPVPRHPYQMKSIEDARARINAGLEKAILALAKRRLKAA